MPSGGFSTKKLFNTESFYLCTLLGSSLGSRLLHNKVLYLYLWQQRALCHLGFCDCEYFFVAGCTELLRMQIPLTFLRTNLPTTVEINICIFFSLRTYSV